MTDLFMHHTGRRGGVDHYDIYHVEDRHRMVKCLGSISMTWVEGSLLPATIDDMAPQEAPLEKIWETQDACYRNHPNIACKCKNCVLDNRCGECGLLLYDGQCTTLGCSRRATAHGTG